MTEEVKGSNPTASDKNEQESSWIDFCLVDYGDGDAEAAVDSIPRPTDIQWTPLTPDYFFHLQEEDPQTPATEKDLLQKGEGGFRTADLVDDKNPSSDEGEEDDISDIFRVWDLNTENPELEKGTLTDIFTSSFALPPSDDDAPELFGSSPSHDDAFDFKELESLESLIADFGDLNISVSVNSQN
ncbi:hypothetical protein KI387_006680, partial [Taxus chinensis]